MDPELRKKLYLQKHKGSIITTAALVLLLPIMVVVSQVTTQFQQKAATRDQNGAQTVNAMPIGDTNYALLTKCFDKPGKPNPCTSTEHKSADLNADGVVDGIDYNIYVRQTAKQSKTP